MRYVTCSGVEPLPKPLVDLTKQQVLRHCKGVAVFTVLRNGLHWSGAAGSGIIVARGRNGQWSVPASILIHTSGWNFPDGGDVYDVEELSNAKILAGEVQAPTAPASQLLEVLKAVEENNHNSNKLPAATKSPGYYVLEAPEEESHRELDSIEHHAGEHMDR